jgi:hypothetical protein
VSWLRLLRRTIWEWALFAFGLALGAYLLGRHVPAALAVVAICAGAAWVGLRALRRSGELAMAWNCPRLDALGVRPAGLDAPWPALRAADATLAALDDAGNFREFFPEARREIAGAAKRLLDAHALLRRAERALETAPKGEGRRRLEEQAARGGLEVVELNALLQELRLRVIASTAPLGAASPVRSLRALEQRTSALASATTEEQP